MIQFIAEIKSNILNNAPLEEAIIFATDTKELFIDVKGQRLQINDVVTVSTEADLDNILAPLANKFYFVEENGIFYKYTSNGWEEITATYKQYQELLALYQKLTTEVNMEYTLLASNWAGNTYTINDPLFTQDSSIRLSIGTISDNQYTSLSNAKIMPDDSDIANNNLILVATGEVPAIDIPIIISIFITEDSLENVIDNLTSDSKINPLSANQGRVLNELIGDLDNLYTIAKDNTVEAINELYLDVTAGKTIVANAITDKGINTATDATYQTMADNIAELPDLVIKRLVSDVTAVGTDVLEGQQFVNSQGQAEFGTIKTFTDSYDYKPSKSVQTISTNGKYLTNDITVAPTDLEDITIKPTTSSQTVEHSTEKDGINSVTVDPILLQEKTVTPAREEQTVEPDAGIDGLSKVTITGDPQLRAPYIKEGVEIFGVVGNLLGAENIVISDIEPESVVTPTIWLDTANGDNILKIYDGTKWIIVRGTWS